MQAYQKFFVLFFKFHFQTELLPLAFQNPNMYSLIKAIISNEKQCKARGEQTCICVVEAPFDNIWTSSSLASACCCSRACRPHDTASMAEDPFRGQASMEKIYQNKLKYVLMNYDRSLHSLCTIFTIIMTFV